MKFIIVFTLGVFSGLFIAGKMNYDRMHPEKTETEIEIKKESPRKLTYI
jgi:hypothetical protein